MGDNNLISHNIKNLRVKFGYSQTFIAEYLKLTPAAVNQYENDARTVPETVIEALAILYNVDEYDLYEKDPEKQDMLTSFAFRADELSAEDLATVSKFKKIINNYLNMSEALNNG
jgi:transcriptional regulator with XRE-family HTH domain